MVRVAINGLGRIGALVLRAGLLDPRIEFVALNAPSGAKNLAYRLKYDSAFGRLPLAVEAKENSIVINGKEIPVIKERDPEKIHWADFGVEVVAECSGAFTSREGAEKHLKSGAPKVLISAPAKNPDITIVKGVNEHLYDKEKHSIISNASCTTNCAALLFKVLNDNFKVKNGFLSTIHAMTATQNVQDGSADEKDFRKGRAASFNIVPTTTGASKAVEEVIPELKGKISGVSYRVPVLVGSIVDAVVLVEKPTSKEEINHLFKSVSQYHLKNLLEYTEDPLVSSDIIGNPHSAIFDAELSDVKGGNFVKISAWYDNEWGFSKRMIDVLKLL